jgi:hypothetical protein
VRVKIVATCSFAFALGTALIFSGVSPAEEVHEVSGTMLACRDRMQRFATRTYSVLIDSKPYELRIQFDGLVSDDIESRFSSACKARGRMKFFYSKSSMSIGDSYWIEGIERVNGKSIFSVSEFRSSQGDNSYFLILFGVLMYGLTFVIYRKGKEEALALSS